MKVVGCIIECGGKILLLKRGSKSDEANTWALVAGKVDGGETDTQAMIREIKEETGYDADEPDLEYLTTFNWVINGRDIEFPTFRLKIDNCFDVVHRPDEHEGYQWTTWEEVCMMDNLVHGLDDILRFLGYK